MVNLCRVDELKKATCLEIIILAGDIGDVEELSNLQYSLLEIKETAEYSSVPSSASLETTGGMLVEAVVSKNPGARNECLFN